VTRWLWLVAVVAGLADAAAGGAFLIVAYDGSRHGWASFRHPAPVPILAIALGPVLIVVGIWRIARAHPAPRR
jgi:hypothetical protein